MRIEEIDKNLKVETSIRKDDIVWLSPKEAPISLHGLCETELDMPYHRLPESVAKASNSGVAGLMWHTAGGRIRFATNSPYIAIKAVMNECWTMPHITKAGQSGFDLYGYTGGKSVYVGTFMPSPGVTKGYESCIDVKPEMNTYTINMPLYDGVTELYIGLAKELQNEPRLVLTGDKTSLAEGLTLYSRNAAQRVEPLNPYGLNKRCGEDFLPDDFLHEQYLLIEEDGKRVLISGCSHKGIVNIAAWFEPDILVGGFHFMRLADEAALLRYADTLLTHPTKYYTGHCTGAEQYALLKARMGERLDALSTGKTIEL